MPLLKRKTLAKAPMPEFLRDDEEVFHCVMTNEIFRDYEEFAERTILCNSMVWACSMTGKTNLTYEEALQSEREAKKLLEGFSENLKVPVMYITMLTKRTSFLEVMEDVYNFVKDRYFVGETVEGCFGNKWKKYQVVQVVGPSQDCIKEAQSKPNVIISPKQYKYSLEQLNPEDADVCENMIVDMTQIRRRKGSFSREKCKLFLKQHISSDPEGVFVIKTTSIEKYNLKNIKFSKMFEGPEPDFVKAKKTKKIKQQTLASFLNKNNIEQYSVQDGTLLTEKIKERERLIKEREALRQRNVEISMKVREWNVPKEDLTLEDQNELPIYPPVKSTIPNKFLGDVLAVLEFCNSFSSALHVHTYFTNGVNLTVMERALLENKIGGPLITLITMFLDAIFTFQEEESVAVNSKLELDKINKTKFKEIKTLKSLTSEEAVMLATKTATWTTRYQGFELYRLPFTPVSVSEILRLHLLSSGARYSENFACRNRSFMRGGYQSEDDPAIHFRLHNSHILKQLSYHNVVELPMKDKLKVLNCLIDQLLTYKPIRDIVDESREKINELKIEVKKKHIADRKQAHELSLEIAKIKKEAAEEKSQSKSQSEAKDVIERSNGKIQTLRDCLKEAKGQNESEVEKLSGDIFDSTSLLGHDRAFRSYLKMLSVPAILVNHEDPNVGTCFEEPVQNNPDLATGEHDAIVRHITKLTDEMNTSDKENEPKEETKTNGDPLMLNGHITPPPTIINPSAEALHMCTGDPKTCIVHSPEKRDPYWSFIDSPEMFNALIEKLNKRGVRESKLQSNLKNAADKLLDIIDSMNGVIVGVRNPKTAKMVEKENLGYPEEMSTKEIMCQSLVDAMLSLEEKLFEAGIGGIEQGRREVWRDNLEKKKFNEPIKENGIKKEELEDMESMSSNQEEYEDPFNYAAVITADIESEDSDTDLETLLPQSEDDKCLIKGLSSSLLELARTIKPKCMRSPLGLAWRKKSIERTNVLPQWEMSLMNTCSFSQIFVHYNTLDDCINWSRSVMKRCCSSCHRTNKKASFVTCEDCNKSMHIFCLKPKLKTVPDEWYCSPCSEAKELAKEKEKVWEEEMDVNENEPKSEEESVDEDASSGCAKCDDEETEDMLKCLKCNITYHLDCYDPPMRRMPRQWHCDRCKKKRGTRERDTSTTSSNGFVDDVVRRSNRIRVENTIELPLHNVALQELLVDVMKHLDAWPFVTPVLKKEVPDYYDIISKPMDFGTIKYKLNMGNYKYDEELMSDLQLVFNNCNLYNNSDDEVYQCGERLLKFVIKRCKELNLRAPENLAFALDANDENDETLNSEDDKSDVDTDDEPIAKKTRTK